MERFEEIPMNLESALKRLKWFVSKKGNSEDIDAMNSVLVFVDLFQKKQIKTSPIVAKFFLHNFLLLTRADSEIYNALTAVNHIKETITRPLDDYYKTLQREVPIARFEALYMDLDKDVREAKRIAEANKVPALKSPTLKDEYRSEDLIKIADAKKERMMKLQKVHKALGTPYTRKEAEYFVETQVKELLLLNND